NKNKLNYLLINRFFFKLLIKPIWNNLILRSDDKNIFMTIINSILNHQKIYFFKNMYRKKLFFNYLKYITNINYEKIISLITTNIKPKKINMIIPLASKITKELIIRSENIKYIEINLINNKEILELIKKKINK